MPRQLSLYHPAGRLGVGANPFGKDVANAGLFRALIRHGGFDRVHVAAARPFPAAELAADAPPPPGATLTTGSCVDPGPLRETGALLRGQPDLAELAWMRRRAGGDHLWSLAGLVHTLAPPATRAVVAEAALAPVQPWDAVVCTSPAVADALHAMFDGWNDHLQARFGGTLRPRPRLPVIPLGVDAARFAAAADRPEARARLRAELGLAEADALVAWVGRLSFFEKAYPQPMFRAVGEAAAATGVRTVFALAGWFPGGEADRARYEAAARAYAGPAEVAFLDGNDGARTADLWAAADVFLSLVDNIQETFGITPLEAMAAGLPVVVSDWDGYRANVRHGEDGFLVPTLGGAPGAVGEGLAARHNLGLESYQTYVGAVAQHTAVDVGAAADALARLIADPHLRRRMGAAGRAHVLARFDWPVVARRYAELFAELEALRPRDAAPAAPRLNPVRGDPFADFAGFATRVLGPDTRVRLRGGDPAAELARTAAVELDAAYGALRLAPEETARLLDRLAKGPLTARALLEPLPAARRPLGGATLVWLCKLGVLAWG